MKIRMLETQRDYKAGEEYELPADVAKRWIDRGRCEPVKAAPKPKETE
jgi:hypothetical protein